MNGLSQLIPDDGTSSNLPQQGLTDQGLAAEQGMTLIRSDNTAAWYASEPQFEGDAGPTYQIIDTTSPDFSTSGTWQTGTDFSTSGTWQPAGYGYAISDAVTVHYQFTSN